MQTLKNLASPPEYTTDGLEIVEINWVKLVIDPSVMSESVQERIRKGRLSLPEANFIGKLIEPGERFLELGGGIGYTSTIVAKQNKAASVTTFEANPQLIPAMKRTHAMNNVVAEAVNAIVSSRKDRDTVPFYIHEDFRCSSLVKPGGGIKNVVEVPVMSFQEVLQSRSPTMLMVDIEGAEKDLFQNLDMSSVKKVYVELHKSIIWGRGIKRIFDFFSDNQFYYDPPASVGHVVLFRKLDNPPPVQMIKRTY